MKIKFTLTILIISIILSACSNSTAVSGEDKEMEIPYTDLTFDICSGENDQFYISDRDMINLFDENGNLVKKYNFENSFFTACTFSDNSLYTIDVSVKKINKLKTDDNEAKEVLPASFAEIASPGSILKIRKNGDSLYLLSRDENYSSKKIIEYNIKEDRVKEIKLDNIISFSIYSEDTLLVAFLENYKTKLCLYNLKSSSVVNTYDFNYSLDNFEYNKDNRKIYYTYNNVLSSADLMKLEPEYICSYLKSKDLVDFTGICLSKNYIYILGSYKGNVKRISKNAKNSLKKLNVVTYFQGELSSAEFNAKYPDYRINNIYIPMAELHEKLKVKLLARDDSFDIYLFQGKILEYLQNNLFVDLKQFNNLADKIDSYIPSIREACTYKEQFFGMPLPQQNNMFVLFYNKDALNNIGITSSDDFITWEDVIKIDERIDCFVDTEPA